MRCRSIVQTRGYRDTQGMSPVSRGIHWLIAVERQLQWRKYQNESLATLHHPVQELLITQRPLAYQHRASRIERCRDWKKVWSSQDRSATRRNEKRLSTTPWAEQSQDILAQRLYGTYHENRGQKIGGEDIITFFKLIYHVYSWAARNLHAFVIDNRPNVKFWSLTEAQGILKAAKSVLMIMVERRSGLQASGRLWTVYATSPTSMTEETRGLWRSALTESIEKDSGLGFRSGRRGSPDLKLGRKYRNTLIMIIFSRGWSLFLLFLSCLLLSVRNLHIMTLVLHDQMVPPAFHGPDPLTHIGNFPLMEFHSERVWISRSGGSS